MDKGLIFNKRVGPNKHVGWNFLKNLINAQFRSVSENPSKVTIRNKKLKLKVEKSQFRLL